jgi:hypothetical protein
LRGIQIKPLFGSRKLIITFLPNHESKKFIQ